MQPDGFKCEGLSFGVARGSHCIPHTSMEQLCDGWDPVGLVSTWGNVTASHPGAGQSMALLKCQAVEGFLKSGDFFIFFSLPNKCFLGFLVLTENKGICFCFPQLAEHSVTSSRIYTRLSNTNSCRIGPKQKWQPEALLGVNLKHKDKHNGFFSDTYTIFKEFPVQVCCF